MTQIESYTLAFVDFEATGLIPGRGAPVDAPLPYITQAATAIHTLTADRMERLKPGSELCVDRIRPSDPEFFYHPQAEEKTQIPRAELTRDGLPYFRDIVEPLLATLRHRVIAGHNVGYDIKLLKIELCRLGMLTEAEELDKLEKVDTAINPLIRARCGLILNSKRGPILKRPTLQELFCTLHPDQKINCSHNALADVRTTARCVDTLLETGVLNSKTLTCKRRPGVGTAPTPPELHFLTHTPEGKIVALFCLTGGDVRRFMEANPKIVPIELLAMCGLNDYPCS